jgi:SAM-dependent methyltransferase
MKEVFRQVPLYRFLQVCNESQLEKDILDCGAGGDQPPLSLFYEYGYHTCGIEFDERQLGKAIQYADRKGQNLHIEQGDMRHLEFADGSFSFVYSYNSIFHMRKADILQSIGELKRVLKPGGLLFVNFLTLNDSRCGLGPQVWENEYEQMDDGPVIHSYYRIDEADAYFTGMPILYKEDRTLERISEGEKIRQGYVDYVLQKAD